MNPKLRYRNDATAELDLGSKTVLLTPEQFAIMAITLRHAQKVAS